MNLPRRTSARLRLPRSTRPQRGLASLVVVMLLFFVVSLLAAYTNRNLIFEQKTSGNQYRATLGFEAAEAGLNWALSMLNSGLVDNTCAASPTGTSFQQRYLAISVDGLITSRARAGNWPSCIYDPGTSTRPGTWLGNCTCPDATSLNPTPAVSAENQQAFRVWLAPGGPGATPPTPEVETITKPTMLVVQSVGCTRFPTSGEGCLSYRPAPEFGDGVGRLLQDVVLRTALAVPPAAAITARGTVTPAPGIAKLRVVNSVNTTSGITLHVADPLLSTDRMELESFPGTPGQFSVSRDQQLAAIAPALSSPTTPLSAGERMFVKMFGMRKSVYKDQPGLRICPVAPATTCTAAMLQNLIDTNPNRIIWVDGPLTLDAPVGSRTAPAMLIIDGDKLTLGTGAATTATQASITGFVYLTGKISTTVLTGPATIDLPDAPTSIEGAVVAEGSLQTTYSVASASAPGNQLTVSYNDVVINLLRWTYGSWVRSGGGWRDFSVFGLT